MGPGHRWGQPVWGRGGAGARLLGADQTALGLHVAAAVASEVASRLADGAVNAQLQLVEGDQIRRAADLVPFYQL